MAKKKKKKKNKPREEAVPRLTKKDIERVLRRSAAGANELLEKLNKAALNASYNLRLD
jgi:hypothetical protein